VDSLADDEDFHTPAPVTSASSPSIFQSSPVLNSRR
jgi:hypothetical protein